MSLQILSEEIKKNSEVEIVLSPNCIDVWHLLIRSNIALSIDEILDKFVNDYGIFNQYYDRNSIKECLETLYHIGFIQIIDEYKGTDFIRRTYLGFRLEHLAREIEISHLNDLI